MTLNQIRRIALVWNKILNFGRKGKKRNLSLVDVGASYFLHKPWIPMILSEEAKLVAVEPNTKNLEYLDFLGVGNIEKHGIALASEQGTRILNVTNVDSGSSIFPPDPSREDLIRSPGLSSYLFPARQVNIEVTTLDILLRGNDTYFALKVDTQGAELEILLGASVLLQNHRILAIEVEVSLLSRPIMAGSPTLANLFDFLTANDFELIWLRPTTPTRRNFKKQERQTEADVLFILRKEHVINNGNSSIEAYESVLRAYGLEQELQVLRALLKEKK